MKSSDLGLVYLASPYSHPDKEVRKHRIEEAHYALAQLYAEGFIAFAPIVHTHAMEKLIPVELAKKHDFWMQQDIAILKHCALLAVLAIPGWEKSVGVQEEISVAKACGMPVFYLPAARTYERYADFLMPNGSENAIS